MTVLIAKDNETKIDFVGMEITFDLHRRILETIQDPTITTQYDNIVQLFKDRNSTAARVVACYTARIPLASAVYSCQTDINNDVIEALMCRNLYITIRKDGGDIVTGATIKTVTNHVIVSPIKWELRLTIELYIPSFPFM
jgi:hypothetical protein